MRPSLSLTMIALLANFAYGFSSEAGVPPGTFFRTSSNCAFKPSSAVVGTRRIANKAPSSTGILLPVRGGGGGSKKQMTEGPIDTGSKCPGKCYIAFRQKVIMLSFVR